MVNSTHVVVLATMVVLAAALLSQTAFSSQQQSSAELLEKAKGLLMQKLDEDDASTKHCGSQCLAKRRRIADQMKALQRQINNDYKNMISFGHKAGYVPPVKSIKEQVMDGSLLSSGDDEAAPPPFDPHLHSTKAFGDKRERELLRSEEPRHDNRSRRSQDRIKRSKRQSSHREEHDSLVLPRVRSVDEMAHKFMHESETDTTKSATTPHRHSPVTFHTAATNAKWKKLFSFMDKGPHDEAAKVVKAPRTTIPSAVRRAIQRALSFATSPHKSRTEKAGDQLLGLKGHRGREANGGKDPIESSKFLRSYFGDGR